ncbi:hypothetical protein BUMB_03594 [Candidatus Paraburkholderia calva]|nr:hypothetical protein BUMB_03594 [Candidatus Paraburkholderia calva]
MPSPPKDAYIEFATDPREVDERWFKRITENAPLRVERKNLNHNAAESVQELIRIGLSYVLLVWNPFVNAIGSEAGKVTYMAIDKWIRKLLSMLAERNDPILAIQSHQNECQVSFIFRCKNIELLYQRMALDQMWPFGQHN